MVSRPPESIISDLLALTQTCATLDEPNDLVGVALPVLLAIGGADAGLAVGPTDAADSDGLNVTHRTGIALDSATGVVAHTPDNATDLVEAPVPPSWRASGIQRVLVRRLPGESGLLVLAWGERVVPDHGEGAAAGLQLALATLDAHLRRTARMVLKRPVDMEDFERRKALEINDNVVQGLVAASYALDQGQVAECAVYLNRTLSSARAMMDGMLEPRTGQGFQPGDLVRSTPATFGTLDTASAALASTPDSGASHTVLVVDDADDLRMLLRSRMEGRRGLSVIGEAADGLAAVELASELQPDLVMLDLAMPRMDGLEALPLIRAAVPGVRVIVLSGFNQNTLAEKAMEAGADRYVIKGGSMRQLLDLVDTVLEDAS